MVGIRETRHFKGVITLTPEDIVEATIFEDWIATKNFFNFDIHNIKGAGLDKNGAQRDFQAKGHYTIPYRALVPKDADNLIAAGRNICATHEALAAVRIMPITTCMGEAAGIAAAMAIDANISMAEVNTKELRKKITAYGGLV
jgi:hypothetical protein